MKANINNGHAKIIEKPNSLSIKIPGKRNWSEVFFVAIWLGFWIYDCIVINQIPNWKSILGIYWIAVIILYMIAFSSALIVLLRQLFRKEYIILTEDEVILKNTVFHIGRKRIFPKKEISNMRLSITEHNNSLLRKEESFSSFSKGKIKFDYGLKTYAFGENIDDAEAAHLLDLIDTTLTDSTTLEVETFDLSLKTLNYDSIIASSFRNE